MPWVREKTEKNWEENEFAHPDRKFWLRHCISVKLQTASSEDVHGFTHIQILIWVNEMKIDLDLDADWSGSRSCRLIQIYIVDTYSSGYIGDVDSSESRCRLMQIYADLGVANWYGSSRYRFIWIYRRCRLIRIYRRCRLICIYRRLIHLNLDADWCRSRSCRLIRI